MTEVLDIIPSNEYYDETSLSEWPDFVETYDAKNKQFIPNKMVINDNNIEFKAIYRRLVEERGIKIKGLKKRSDISKYLVLLAKAEIIRKNLNITSTFKNKEQLDLFYDKLQYDLDMYRFQMMPIIKSELIPSFNIFTIERYRNDIKNRENLDSKERLAVLSESIWKTLERFFEDPNSFNYHLSKDDIAYWSRFSNRGSLINLHFKYISEIYILELYAPSVVTLFKTNENAAKEIKQLMRRLPQTKTAEERTRINNNKKRLKQEKEESIDKLVSEFINNLYVVDEKSFILTSEILVKYKQWLEQEGYDDDKNDEIEVTKLGRSLVRLGLTGRRRNNGNGYHLKLKDDISEDEDSYE